MAEKVKRKFTSILDTRNTGARHC